MGICVITALRDPLCTPERNMSFLFWTTGEFQALTVDDGHYTCLKASRKRGVVRHFPLGELFIKDLVKSLSKIRWTHLCGLSRVQLAPGMNALTLNAATKNSFVR